MPSFILTFTFAGILIVSRRFLQISLRRGLNFSRLQCLNLNYLKQKGNHQKSVLYKKRRCVSRFNRLCFGIPSKFEILSFERDITIFRENVFKLKPNSYLPPLTGYTTTQADERGGEDNGRNTRGCNKCKVI